MSLIPAPGSVTKHESDTNFSCESGTKYSAASVPAAPAPPPPPPPLQSPVRRHSLSKKRPSLPKATSPGLTERPSNVMVSVEGDNTMAALSSPRRKSSLKKTYTRDSSTPVIDATATARRSQPAPLLQALSTGDAAKSRRDSSEFTAAAPERSALTGSEVDMEVWVPDEQKVWVQGRVIEQVGRSELLVRTRDGAQVKIDMAATPELYTANPTLEADMTSLRAPELTRARYLSLITPGPP